jgi:hypothetical protein
MGKRNVRIHQAVLANRLSELNGKIAHVILKDGTTFSGEVTKASLDGIVLVDCNAKWTQIRSHTHQIPLEKVEEVIYDLIAAY